MLAVQFIHLQWNKDSRTPKGAVQRREYLHPRRIPGETDLKGTGEIFYQQCHFYQSDSGKMITLGEYLRGFVEHGYRGKENSTSDHFKRQIWQRVADAEQRAKGIFIEHAADCRIKGIDIIPQGENFEIQFYSLGEEGLYVPPRYGKNIKFKAEEYNGKSLKREVALELAPGESGVIRYNYRQRHSVTGYEGVHCEHFEIYMVNTDDLNTNTFTKAKYEKVYEDIVVLY